ncbi:MAG: acyl--CoA ligase [Clostridia bacterium]|nr:acyl--CoA ligase [Clostridia bacterium]
MPIFEYLERNAREYPDDVALVEINPKYEPNARMTWKNYSLVEPQPGEPFRRELTWKAFDDKANMFANLLFTRGIQKGEKVAILLMNSIEWLPIYFGILKAGAVAVPLNYRYDASEIKYCLEKSDSSMLVFGPEFVGRIEEIVDRIPKVEELFYVGEDCPSFADSYEKMIKFCSHKKPEIKITDEDDGVIYFSSGTTGFPKAILHAHMSLVHSCKAEQAHHGQTRDDCFLCIPPLYHTGAKMHWFGSLISGSRAVLLKGTTPELIIKTMSEEKCTIIWLLVPWMQDVLDNIDNGNIDLSKYKLSQWRLTHSGAQPIPPALIKRWLTIFPTHQYDTNYGLSESIGPGCIHLGVENVEHVGALGKPGFGWEIKLCDEEGNEVSTGEVGEICIKGPGVMKCYYNDEKASEETLKDGWLLSGDMGMMDEEGFIHIVDRKKDVIISGGENLYPVQIENFLRKNTAIKDAAVIGTPDDRLGEIATAVIEVKEGFTITEGEVNDFCMDLPRYKRPRKIIFADIPRNPTGKIEKPVLRQRYCGTSVVAHQVGED